MEFNVCKTKLDNIPNGRLFHAKWVTDLEKKVSASARKNGYQVFKTTEMPCRKGIEYSNQKMIAEIMSELGYVVGDRANGTKDNSNIGFADSKLGNKLVDLYSMDCMVDRVQADRPINAPKTEYKVIYKGTEKIVTRAELKALGIMQNSFFNEADNEAKVAEMLKLKAEWEADKPNFKGDKIKLAKLIRDCYNKMFSVKVENIIDIR